MRPTVTITLELSPEAAAGLKRFAEKVSHEQASAVLYPHVNADVRGNQAHDILIALDQIDKALTDADVRSWPWIECGKTEPNAKGPERLHLSGPTRPVWIWGPVRAARPS